MRIKAKKLKFIINMINISTFIFIIYIQVKMINSGNYIKLPIINKVNFEIVISILTSLFSVVLILNRIIKYKKIANQQVDIYIDIKSDKKITLYLIGGLDIFLILLFIGMRNVLGIIILANAFIWTLIVIKWIKFDDGFYDKFLFYNSSVFFTDKIEKCLIDEKKIELTVLKKVFFFEVINKIELALNYNEKEKLFLLIDSSKVVLLSDENNIQSSI